eukprot:COSAG03_NODE_439_length_7918_cov_13.498785_6_plen_54_part_00
MGHGDHAGVSSTDRPRGECHGRAGMQGSVTERESRNVTLYLIECHVAPLLLQP